MGALERFGVSMEPQLLAQFDALTAARGYASRSEAIRDLARQEIVKEEWSNPEAEVMASVTIVYEHHAHDLAHSLTELQHTSHGMIVCTTHVHLDAHNCLEVVILRGKSAKVKAVADSLVSTRGVKHGQICATTTGGAVAHRPERNHHDR